MRRRELTPKDAEFIERLTRFTDLQDKLIEAAKVWHSDATKDNELNLRLAVKEFKKAEEEC